MQSSNPFDLIIARLDQLQSTVNLISDNAQKASVKNSDQDRLMDLTEAAAIVRRPVGTVRYYIHHRNLPATKIGKGYLIKLNELLKWVDEFNKTNGNEKGTTDPMLNNRKRYRKS